MKMRTLIISVVVLVLLAPLAAAQVTTQLPLPADLQGELDGAPYRILVPANWNGVLLVFVHGFVSPSVDVVPATTPAVQPSLQEQLLTLGYALAASNSESVEKKAVQSTVALTGFFKEQVGPPKRIIVWGVSFGSGVALKLIEKHSGIYDGAIANCAVSAGTAENMDAALAFSLAYAAAFTWHDDLWGPVGDVRDGLNATQEVLPVMKTDGTVPATLAFGRWEFIRLVLQLPPQAFWGTDPQLGMPFLLLQMWKATERRAVAEAYWGGPLADNTNHNYTLTQTEQDYLVSKGVPQADIATMLDYMNARTNIKPDVVARKHLEQWGAYSGQLKRPVLTMHATYDGLAPTANESYYAALVQAAGSDQQLVQTYVNLAGHCSFTAEQYLAGVAAMNLWIETGERPDASLLPASKGFNWSFVPGPWVF